MIIGLTGGIASGKSTVSRILSDMGIKIVDGDKIARDLSERHDVIEEICEKISPDVLDESGKIHRLKLKNIVFNNKEKLETLNKIFHPKITEELKKIKYYHLKSDIIIFDIPLLFETGMNKLCDKTVLIYVKRSIQIKRIVHRDNIGKDLAEKIIDSQMGLDEKKALADYHINNNKTITILKEKVEDLIEEIKKENL